MEQYVNLYSSVKMHIESLEAKQPSLTTLGTAVVGAAVVGTAVVGVVGVAVVGTAVVGTAVIGAALVVDDDTYAVL